MRTVTSLPRICADEHRWKYKKLTALAQLRGKRKILIEAKPGRHLGFRGQKQLLNDLRATDIEVVPVVTFGATAQFQRCLFENDRKTPRNPSKSAQKKLPGSCR
jgi:16S rRNA A1518/A1519 N6-dimethyltransferase RsmA/KsgA/DIM1 with predicted DNA glycosylase/AP lyase activity